ncbi:MAG: hypothetical protein ACKOI2_04820 [Actinomycetota bacterium]
MSFKKKLVTAVTTAGLLAGIFGSAFAPVAQAASAINTKLIKSELKGNVYEWNNYWYGSSFEPAGTADDPWIIYAPVSNDGDSPASEADLDQIIETYVEDDDILFANGDLVSDSDDVIVKATTTGGLLVDVQDDDSNSCETTEDYYSTSSDTSDAVDGFLLCLAAADDDDSFTSTVTVSVNGTQVATFVVRVVGPGQSLALTSRTGTWIAMDNEAIASGARIAFLDKSGYNLWTNLWDYDDALWDAGDFESLIETYWKDGYDASGDADLEYSVDDVSNGTDFDTNDKLDEGSNARTIELNAEFCDADMDDVGDSHTIYAFMDSSNGIVSSGDTKSNGLVFKCSGSGEYDAYITGFKFAASTVEAGEAVALDIQISDEAGNPMGAGSAYDLDFGTKDILDSETYFWVTGDYSYISFFPIHEDVTYNTYNGDYYLSRFGTDIQYESPDDLNSTCEVYETYDEGPEAGQDFTEYMTGNGLDYVGDGVVRLCWTASTLKEDLGVNTARLSLDHAYTDALAGIIGFSPVSFKAQVTVVAADSIGSGAVGLGASLTVTNKKVSVTGPVGAAVTFVVQNRNMVVKTYTRLVGANGKAVLKFTKAGKYTVYAMLGDSDTSLKTFTVK